MVGAISEAYWVKLCAAVGRPDLAADQRLATNADRVRNSELVIPQLKEIFRSKSREQWSRILDHAGMAFSPVYPLHEAIVSPQARHNRVLRQMRDDDGRAVTAVRSPISNDAWPPLRMDFPPALGRDSRDVLRILLAMSDAEIAALTDAGAVSLGEEADQI
jgi:crotonobetainyl-CoA:carnitine CoA-transferase CaiB-like acyl-CoA transferase